MAGPLFHAAPSTSSRGRAGHLTAARPASVSLWRPLFSLSFHSFSPFPLTAHGHRGRDDDDLPFPPRDHPRQHATDGALHAKVVQVHRGARGGGVLFEEAAWREWRDGWDGG